MINNKILVHVRAPMLTESGYGVASRQLMDVLLEDERMEVVLESINWGTCSFIHGDPRIQKYYECMAKYEQVKQQNIPIDVSFQVTIPNEFTRVGQVNIGCTAGIEVDKCTKEWIEKCNTMEAIVVPSTFSKKVLESTVIDEKRIVKNIIVIPHWFDKPKEIKESRFNFSTSRNVLGVFQWGNKGGFREDRKNVAELIKQFCAVFKENANAGLVLKTAIIANNEKDKLETIKRISEIKANFPNAKCKIHLIHESLSEEEMWSLYHHKDSLGMVSLTCGEGFGLPMLEASAAGLPVIATDYSGHKDFLREKHGFLPVEYNMDVIPECQVWPGVIDKGTKWAQFKEESFSRRVRKLIDSPQTPREQSLANYSWLYENFSKEKVTEKWKKFFGSFIQDQAPDETNEQFQQKQVQHQRKSIADAVFKDVEKSDNKKVLYVMPQSAGDVLISTPIVNALKNRHFDCDFYFATTEPFKPLLSSIDGIKVIDYHDQMLTAEITREVFDYVYTPGVNVQYQFSNWLLGNGEYGLKLLEEFAKNCNLFPGEIQGYSVPTEETKLPDDEYIVFGPAGIKPAKEYLYWDDVISNIKEMLPGIKIVQIGLPSEKKHAGTEDYTGLTYAQSAYLMKNAMAFIGVDSYPAHLAAACSVPHVVMYGCTSAQNVAPVMIGRKVKQYLIESSACDKKCWKDVCLANKDGKNCMSHIDAEAVCNVFYTMVNQLEDNQEQTWVAQPANQESAGE